MLAPSTVRKGMLCALVTCGLMGLSWAARSTTARPIPPAVFVAPAQDGKRLMHAHLLINGSHLMLADDFPEYAGGKAAAPPASV